jgi:hypothetical protein
MIVLKIKETPCPQATNVVSEKFRFSPIFEYKFFARFPAIKQLHRFV